jgi:hypothetical protein
VRLSISSLRAAGVSADQIMQAVEIEQAKRDDRIREQTRERVRAHRTRNASNARNAVTSLHKKIANEISEPKTGTEIAQETLLLTESVKKESIRANKHGTRLPAGWRPSEQDWGWAVQHGLTATEIANEAERFTDYWIAKPGEKGCKLNWSATWRNWCRSFLDRNDRQPSLPIPIKQPPTPEQLARRAQMIEEGGRILEQQERLRQRNGAV